MHSQVHHSMLVPADSWVSVAGMSGEQDVRSIEEQAKAIQADLRAEKDITNTLGGVRSPAIGCSGRIEPVRASRPQRRTRPPHQHALPVHRRPPLVVRPQGSVSRASKDLDDACKLCCAVTCGDLRLLSSLIASKCDPSKGDYDLRTPLHIAAAQGNLEACKILVDAGAILKRDRFGMFPIHDAVTSGNRETLEYLRTVDTEVHCSVVVASSPVGRRCLRFVAFSQH